MGLRLHQMSSESSKLGFKKCIDEYKWCKGSAAHKVFKSSTIYEIMETMCPPRYHRSGFVAIHALGHMHGCQVLKCMNFHKAIALMTGSAHCFHDST